MYPELYEYLNYEILKWVVHTKICTNENYPLYGTNVYNIYSHVTMVTLADGPGPIVVLAVSLHV